MAPTAGTKSSGRRLTTRAKVGVLLGACGAGVVAVAISLVGHRADATAGGRSVVRTGNTVPISSGGQQVLFRSAAVDDYYAVKVADIAHPDSPTGTAPFACSRLDFEGGRGVCLGRPNSGVGHLTATVFDSHLRTLHRVTLFGYPSRVRVSPDGHYAGATAFVSGDSYAVTSFSTRTSIIDLRTGTVLFTLEKLDVRRNGRPFHAVDFNFWGVTFEKDSRHFFATLGTGGHTYLIEGDIATKTATVVQDGIECPSLSPDNREIAFKKRVAGPVVTWHLWVLDLATMKEHPVAETRDVDDQVEWLDNGTLMYGLAHNLSQAGAPGQVGSPTVGGPSGETDTWSVPADGHGVPREVVPQSWSVVVAR